MFLIGSSTLLEVKVLSKNHIVFLIKLMYYALVLKMYVLL